MYTKQEIIIKSYREGQSQRRISRELHVSRKTVRKYILEYESHLRDKQSGAALLSEYLSKPSVYQAQNRSKLKLTREVQASIDKLLEENTEKKRQGLGKQLLKKCDIHEQLNGQGFDIGYTTVCNYIRSKSARPQSKEAFIRQKYEPGETCEFDWGEIKLYIKDEQVRFQLAVFTSAYSNYRFAAFYQRQDTLAFMESHVAFFDFTKGVYRQMVYDNMRVAVAKFVGPHEKEPTQALLQLRGHYQFSHRFCNAYRGNEKGHVERSVEYIRRKSFGVKCKFDSQKEAEQWLMFTINKLNATRQKLTGKTANELFSEEAKVLPTAPAKLACAEQVQLRVDKYSTVTYRTNRYSVPDHLVGCFIDVKILSLQIQIYQNRALLASHERSYKKHQWIIAIEHYLDTFKQKPGALPGSVALASSAYLKQLYIEYFKNEPRDFIDLLDYCHKNQVSDEKLQGAVTRLQKSGVRQITAEKTKVLLGNKQSESTHIPCDQIVQLAKTQLSEQAALMN
jgi:transposase